MSEKEFNRFCSKKVRSLLNIRSNRSCNKTEEIIRIFNKLYYPDQIFGEEKEKLTGCEENSREYDSFEEIKIEQQERQYDQINISQNKAIPQLDGNYSCSSEDEVMCDVDGFTQIDGKVRNSSREYLR